MSPWLKAGLIGAAVLVVLNLLGLIPCVWLVTCILGLLAYAGIGALAAYYMPPRREAGTAAGQGALAALVASLIGGIVTMITFVVQASMIGSAQILSQIPPEALKQFEDAGMDPQILDTLAGPVGALISGGFCCAGGVVVALALGAIGGAIFAGIRPE